MVYFSCARVILRMTACRILAYEEGSQIIGLARTSMVAHLKARDKPITYDDRGVEAVSECVRDC